MTTENLLSKSVDCDWSNYERFYLKNENDFQNFALLMSLSSFIRMKMVLCSNWSSRNKKMLGKVMHLPPFNFTIKASGNQTTLFRICGTPNHLHYCSTSCVTWQYGQHLRTSYKTFSGNAALILTVSTSDGPSECCRPETLDNQSRDRYHMSKMVKPDIFSRLISKCFFF